MLINYIPKTLRGDTVFNAVVNNSIALFKGVYQCFCFWDKHRHYFLQFRTVLAFPP